MGFQVEINSILRTDEEHPLVRGSEHPFRKAGSRVFFDDIPIWLTRTDWTAVAEIRVLSQTRTASGVEGIFRVLHVYPDAERQVLTVAFRRMFAGGTDPFIYLLMNPADFEQAQKAGTWDPPSRAVEGFIHASPAKELTRVANKHYLQFDEVRVVALRHELVHSEILWEPASNSLYPHVYGPINMDVAERVVPVRKGADGHYLIDLGD
ncbi:MAG TPA: DUF952 domain-containing protein [Gemmataceae bacterium]|nr:DUF952 domain-containing protein [Gemmataceae bacterium]